MFRYFNVQVFLRWFLIIVFGIFLTRTIDLMLIRGAYYRDLADNNRVRKVAIPAARGKIITVEGNKLAQNDIAYFNLKGERISREQALKLQANEVDLLKKWVREYSFKEMTAQITGYLGQANEEEIKELGLSLGSIVGRAGLEEFYDDWLRGEDGEKIIEVGVNESVIRELGRKEPEPGNDLIVSIDLNWQKSAWEAMGNKKGAIVILNPDNGAVLGLVSKPSFDPNVFIENSNEVEIEKILNNDQLPMLNRAIGGAYPPGSTYKMVTATAGLEEGRIDADKQIEDTGVIEIGEWKYANWYWTDYGATEGMVNLKKAIQRSNDIYFYRVGEWVGINALVDWGRKFNFGQKTGVDLPGEVTGLLPTPDWKRKAKGESWFLGNTYHMAIGQGDLTATPLQIALETAVIANGGKLCQPHLKQMENNKCRMLNISRDHIESIKDGMYAACSTGGTGFPFFEFNENLPQNQQVACKTGTAEISDNSDDTHAWFTLFYSPNGVTPNQVVITVLLERGGSGAYDAAPIAKEIIERYEGRYQEPTREPEK